MIMYSSECGEVYVPKWPIIIETAGLTYKRESIASANSISRGETDLCPKGTGKDIRKTCAICEICGMAVCSNHAIKDNDKYSCYDRETSDDNNTSSKLEEKIKDLSTSLNTLKTLFKQEKVIYRIKKISALIKINSI